MWGARVMGIQKGSCVPRLRSMSQGHCAFFPAWPPCAVTVGAESEAGARTELVRGAREWLQRV